MRIRFKLNLRLALLLLLFTLILYSVLLIYKEYSYELLIQKTIVKNNHQPSEIHRLKIKQHSETLACPPGKIYDDQSKRCKSVRGQGIAEKSLFAEGHIFNNTERLIEMKHSGVTLYNLSQPAHDDYRCVEMKTNPSLPICIYPLERDRFISHDLATTGLWEPAVLFDFMDVLHRDPSIGVIDIGANIGVYSLLSAKMGHRVVAVEPNLESCRHLHKSAILSRTTDKILLLRNAIADYRSSAMVISNAENQGDVRVHIGPQTCQGVCPEVVNSILLDDLLLVSTFKRAIMKLDCQGFEHLAFQHAEKLLRGIDVTHIYMEWSLLATFYSGANKKAVESLIEFLLWFGYRPFTLDMSGSTSLDPESWHKWADDVVWRRLPDEKEQRMLWKNHFMNWP